jgi:hypothetical protein
MTTWTSQLTATSGDYTPILQTITPDDGECLQSVFDTLQDYATATNTSLLDYITKGICVALSEQIEDENIPIKLENLATLKAVGLIITTDYVHIGLTPLAYGFLNSVNTPE